MKQVRIVSFAFVIISLLLAMYCAYDCVESVRLHREITMTTKYFMAFVVMEHIGLLVGGILIHAREKELMDMHNARVENIGLRTSNYKLQRDNDALNIAYEKLEEAKKSSG